MTIATVVPEVSAAPAAPAPAIVTGSDVRDWTETVAAPLAAMLKSTKAATSDKVAYASEVFTILEATVEASQQGANTGLAAKVLASLATRDKDVGKILKAEGLAEEESAKIVAASTKKLHELSGPLWRLAHLLESNCQNVVDAIGKEKQTLSGFNKWSEEQIDALAFHENRKTVTISYTPVRGDASKSFTVGSATETRDKHAKAVKVAAKIEETNGKKWAAVRRQYRIDNDAGMPDGRTANELKVVDAKIKEDLFASLSTEQRDKLRATL